MQRNMLACCKLYISESRNTQTLHQIETSLHNHPNTKLINKFTDEIYNRVGYTLISTVTPNKSSPLKQAAFDMLKAAYECIDLGLHCGAHPRLGAVDHVCFHPLREGSLDRVAELARSVAERVGEELEVPTYLYGAAHPSGRTLASIRRQLGYFKPNPNNQTQWSGSLLPETLTLTLTPDFGPTNPPQTSKGVLTLGATKWVDNYNVPVHHCRDVQLVRRIARRVSGRGGGIEGVEAMGLGREEGVMEVACNLVGLGRSGGERVQTEVERLGREEGVAVGKGYFTDFWEEKIVELYLESVESM